MRGHPRAWGEKKKMPRILLPAGMANIIPPTSKERGPSNTSKVKRKEGEKKEKREINKKMNIVLLSFSVTII
jgi:hypothetical protein